MSWLRHKLTSNRTNLELKFRFDFCSGLRTFFQSYQSGIEIVTQTQHFTRVTSNRTNLELKSKLYLYASRTLESSNRTNLELKLGKLTDDILSWTLQSYQSGIEIRRPCYSLI